MLQFLRTEKIIKSRYDASLYANDAVQFFYGNIEPYYYEDTEVFGSDYLHEYITVIHPGVQPVTRVANELVDVRPLPPPNVELQFVGFHVGHTTTIPAYRPTRRKNKIDDKIPFWRGVPKLKQLHSGRSYANNNIFKRR